MRKCTALVLLITCLVVSILMVFSVTPTTVQAVSKPSVPEFSLQFVDNSYDVPPTFSKDPFTGETVMTKEGYHVDNRTIEVKIKNQPFTPYTDSQGNGSGLWYDIRWKGHFDDYWQEYSSGYGKHYLNAQHEYNSDGLWSEILSQYSTVTYVVGTNRADGQFPDLRKF